jgi:hypothetical protein
VGNSWKKEIFLRKGKEGFTDAISGDGKVIMRFDQRENLLELDSETGGIKLNGYELPRVNKMDIQMSGYNDAKVTLDLDITPGKILLLIEGSVKWFEGADREKYFHGQDN